MTNPTLKCRATECNSLQTAQNFINSFGIDHDIQDFQVDSFLNPNGRFSHIVVVKFLETRAYACAIGRLAGECSHKKDNCSGCESNDV